MKFVTIKPTQLSRLPSCPGVYLHRNSQSSIIYVGKAINLKKRISQYFQRPDALGSKTSSLVSQIHRISFCKLNSEIEALVLESSLIKRYRPHFNSQLADDRSYLYICITKDKIPLVVSAYKSALPSNSVVYGPFPNARSVKSLLKIIRRLFPYRTTATHPAHSCLYCHLHLCPGANPDPRAYRLQISKIKKILNGQIHRLQKQLAVEMKRYSRLEDYEQALECRRQLESIQYVVDGWRDLSSLYQDVELPDDLQSRAVNELNLLFQPYSPVSWQLKRLECFDISQLGNRYFVGAMTVFQNNRLAKDQYRKFKIKFKTISPDDQFMIKEIVWRRSQHPNWPSPDLIVVDGGKPQVSAVSALFGSNQTFFRSVLVIGLAKREETIIIKEGESWQEISLPQNSAGLNLLKMLRDEAHRFANKYRKELIKNSIK